MDNDSNATAVPSQTGHKTLRMMGFLSGVPVGYFLMATTILEPASSWIVGFLCSMIVSILIDRRIHRALKAPKQVYISEVTPTGVGDVRKEAQDILMTSDQLRADRLAESGKVSLFPSPRGGQLSSSDDS